MKSSLKAPACGLALGSGLFLFPANALAQAQQYTCSSPHGRQPACVAVAGTVVPQPEAGQAAPELDALLKKFQSMAGESPAAAADVLQPGAMAGGADASQGPVGAMLKDGLRQLAGALAQQDANPARSHGMAGGGDISAAEADAMLRAAGWHAADTRAAHAAPRTRHRPTDGWQGPAARQAIPTLNVEQWQGAEAQARQQADQVQQTLGAGGAARP